MLPNLSGDLSPAESSIITMPTGPIPGTTQYEQPAIRSRQNNAVGIELTIQNKALELIWDWRHFVNPFPDPITLTDKVNQCWSDARRILGLPNFPDTAPHSHDQVSSLGKLEPEIRSRTEYGIRWTLVGQIRGKHSFARSQYLHCVKKVVAALYKLDTEYPTVCAQMVQYLLMEDRCNCSRRRPNGYEVTFSSSFFPTISVRHRTRGVNSVLNLGSLHLRSLIGYSPNFITVRNGEAE